ncbi:hypothetical protein EV177_001291 [Coemansia sp. RSA 1804]|nr:hypothetical protein EV177_001291 [Coemansia sp. RSA 1804]
MLSDPTWQSAHMQQPPITGSNQAGLGNANPGISNAGLTPGATLSIPQTVSDVSSTSTSSVPSSDVDEARTNGIAIAPTSHFAAALGLCEGNNGDNEGTHGNPFASLDSCKEDSIVSGNNDDFELPGSPEPNGDPAGKKRNRLRPEQTRRLMEIFERTPKPDSEMRKILGKQLEMTPRTVQIWFQNRRAKLKRESNTVNLMRNSVYAASGIFDSRNAHRLTYNRAYINRRPTGRVASDGYAHLRNISEFEPYPPNTVHGLTLQSPSQISIPLSLRVQPPFPTLNSAPASAYPGSEPQMFGNSAMGVPVGQAKQNGVPNSASDIGGIIPNLNPFINTGNSNDAMQASLPHSASFPYSAHATSFSPSATPYAHKILHCG